jgi:uncharacterized protein (TIRG00374 family)
MSDVAMVMTPRRRIWPLALRWAGALLFLAWVFTRMADLPGTIEVIGSARSGWIFAAVLLAFCGELITAWKWVLLVRVVRGKLPFIEAVRASFIGMFYNNFLPGSVGGDLARVLVIKRWTGSKVTAAASTFMQRVTGLGGLLIVAVCAGAIWPFSVTRWNSWMILSWPLTWFVMTALGYTGVCLVLFNEKIYRLVWRAGHNEAEHRFPGVLHSMFHQVVVRIRRLHNELHAYNPWSPVPLLLSIVTQLLDTVFVFGLAKAIGIEAPFYIFLSAVPMISLASLLPITLNGIGLREAAYIGILGTAGVSPEAAAGLSLLQFATIVLFSALGASFTLSKPAPAGWEKE